MNSEAVREMTFEEEYEILQREKERVFASEHEGCEPPLANCVLRRALRCIRKLQEQQLKTDWIPCEERLPKKKGYYQCTVFRYEDDEHNVFDLWFEDGEWYVDEVDEETKDEFLFVHEVIAWQPLPQPYKKEGAERMANLNPDDQEQWEYIQEWKKKKDARKKHWIMVRYYLKAAFKHLVMMLKKVREVR